MSERSMQRHRKIYQMTDDELANRMEVDDNDGEKEDDDESDGKYSNDSLITMKSYENEILPDFH